MDAPHAHPAVRLDGVTRTFHSRRAPIVEAVRDVSLQIRGGEFVSIVGPSGCGKSTLLNIIAGLDTPTAGSVAVHGEQRSVEARRRTVAYMPQKDLLFPWRTVLDNVILGLEVGGVPRREARERARALLPAFGLAEFGERRPYELSGGMRQRAALLRTVLVERPLLLLDEPFGALDAITRTQLQTFLLDQWRTLERSAVLVTHDVREAVALSDRIYVMSARPGTIVAEVVVDSPRPRPADQYTEAAFITAERAVRAALAQHHAGAVA